MFGLYAPMIIKYGKTRPMLAFRKYSTTAIILQSGMKQSLGVLKGTSLNTFSFYTLLYSFQLTTLCISWREVDKLYPLQKVKKQVYGNENSKCLNSSKLYWSLIWKIKGFNRKGCLVVVGKTQRTDNKFLINKNVFYWQVVSLAKLFLKLYSRHSLILLQSHLQCLLPVRKVYCTVQ